MNKPHGVLLMIAGLATLPVTAAAAPAAAASGARAPKRNAAAATGQAGAHSRAGGQRGPAPRPAIHYVRPAPPMPFLPSIARVRVAVGADDIVVTHEVNLPRGDYRSGNLRFFIAFGAPGIPRAIETTLVPVADGALEPEPHATGVPLDYERAIRALASDYALLGPEQMAGIVIKVSESAFKSATTSGLMATLRVRTQLAKPPADDSGARSLVIRLGAVKDQGPLTLLRVDVNATKAPAAASATLCDADNNGPSLSVITSPPPTSPAPDNRIAPVLAVRNARDNLCVRWVEGP
jgi:hypothetical protein